MGTVTGKGCMTAAMYSLWELQQCVRGVSLS